MESNNRAIIFLIGIVVILLIIFFVIVNSNNKKETVNQEVQINTVEDDNISTEEYVNILEDGTKLNNNSNLQKDKIFDNMEITDIQLTEKDGVSQLIANVTNNTQEIKGGYPIRIKMLDDKQNEIVTIDAYLKELEPGESTQLSTSATQDFANSYDKKLSFMKLIYKIFGHLVCKITNFFYRRLLVLQAICDGL